MDQTHHWWEPAVTWLNDNLMGLLGVGFAAVSGFVTKNLMFRSGIKSLEDKWDRFEKRFEALEVERAEYRRLAASRMDDLGEQVAEIRAHIGDCISASEKRYDEKFSVMRAEFAEQLLLTDQRLDQIAQTNADLAAKLAESATEEHRLFRLLLKDKMGGED